MVAHPDSITGRAAALAESFADPIIDLTIRLTEIGSPTFEEGDRAAALAEVYKDFGYENVIIDDIHDVTAVIPGKDRSKSLLVAAHIDTVFPKETDVTVHRKDHELHAPGIGDNTLAVASVAMLKKAFEELGETPAIDILVAGNVGEEGLGDLRGMKAVVDANPNIAGALAIEGQWLGRITHVAVGSKRYRVTVTGPGGHSWGAAGTPSAIHHLCRMIAKMDEIPLQADPKTSFNAGVVHGGVSVNTIAPDAYTILDMRSVDADALAALVARVDEILDMEAPEGVSVEIEIVGDRPAGSDPKDGKLATIAASVLRELGYEPIYDAASTDANVPISRGIPGLCIGISTGGNMHREDEWIDTRPIPTGFAQLVSAVLQSAEALAE